MTATDNERADVGRRRLIVLVPLVVFLGLVLLFLIRLCSGDPSRIPSALIGHPAPQTTCRRLPASIATASRCRASTRRVSRAR